MQRKRIGGSEGDHAGEAAVGNGDCRSLMKTKGNGGLSR
jgi:hypothetical protein